MSHLVYSLMPMHTFAWRERGHLDGKQEIETGLDPEGQNQRTNGELGIANEAELRVQ